MEIINFWASKKMYISIFSVLHKDRIEWSVGIRIGLDSKNQWLPNHDEGCQFSSFLTPDKALKEAVSFCENYKPKATKSLNGYKKKK